MIPTNVAIIDWEKGSSASMQEPFRDLGIKSGLYDPREPLPRDTDLIFSYGYFPDFFQFLDKLEEISQQHRPYFIHWNTEGVPDLRFPSWIARWGGMIQSSISRQARSPNANPLVRRLSHKAHRFRYLGDYLYASRKGFIQALYDCSVIYVALERKIGLPARYVHWGTFRSDYETLNLERDIDVLWMGKPRGKRRNELVQTIREALARYGKNMVVVDGIEHPYVFGAERTRILNRTKVTLNLLPAWDAYNHLFKFHLAAGNRSLLISEPFLRHNPEYIENEHYVTAKEADLVKVILDFCENEPERQRITENAYQLVTNTLTMKQSIGTILTTAFQARQ